METTNIIKQNQSRGGMNTSQPITIALTWVSGTTTRWHHPIIMQALGGDNMVDGMGPVGSHHISRAAGGSRPGSITSQVGGGGRME